MTTEGDQIGAYRIRKRIGAGGMGEVWLAEHALLGRRAAIKLLHPTFSSQPDVVARFFNEARAATAIADPGIVQIFDFGHDHDVAYIVMEMLDGETLEARRHRGISVSDALRIVRQVASSLGAAHARGIIHRDLKPENIFLVRDPEVVGGERAKILDFGIAKLTGDATAAKTQTSAVMGTPTFMSPEQCRGAGYVDQRSDIYSLGCVLFTILAGRPPFVADGVGELIVKHMTEPPPRASSFVPMPAAVDDLIARCLDKDPSRRYASGTALAAALGALVTDPGSAAAPSVGALTTATTLSGATGATTPSAQLPRRRGVVIATTATVVLALASVAVWDLGRAPNAAPAVHASTSQSFDPISDALAGFGEQRLLRGLTGAVAGARWVEAPAVTPTPTIPARRPIVRPTLKTIRAPAPIAPVALPTPTPDPTPATPAPTPATPPPAPPAPSPSPPLIGSDQIIRTR